MRIMLQWLLSAATVLMAALLIWQCVTIYHEGIAPEKIFTTGNTVIDALLTTVDENYAFADPVVDALLA